MRDPCHCLCSPKKRNASDRNRKPAVYAPLPAPPPEYMVVSQ